MYIRGYLPKRQNDAMRCVDLREQCKSESVIVLGQNVQNIAHRGWSHRFQVSSTPPAYAAHYSKIANRAPGLSFSYFLAMS